MHLDFLRIGLFVAGVILIFAALLGGRLASDPAAARPRRALQVALAVGGVALMAWAALPYFARTRTAGASVPTAAPPSAATPSTVAPTAATSPQIDAVALASPAVAACPVATAPQVPDGGSASLQQMNAARTAFHDYDAATNAYAKCVDSAIQRLVGELRGKASPDELQRLDQFGRSAHNTAIDQEQAVADRLNAQIRAFKARHP